MEARISYIKKNYCSGGIVSFTLSLIALAFLGVSFYLSYKTAGTSSELAVVIGFCGALTSLTGLGYGIGGFFEVEKNHLFSKIGTTINVLLLIGIVSAMILGGR